MNEANAQKKTPKSRNGDWQAVRSEVTRNNLLDSVVACFIKYGYAKTTTSRVAAHAKVSRGAMIHHFPARVDLIKAAILHLHEIRTREYRDIMSGIDNLSVSVSEEATVEAVEAYWKFVNLPSFIALNELRVASRCDEELSSILTPLERVLEKEQLNAIKHFFPQWEDLGSKLDLARDLLTLLFQGMVLGPIVGNKKARVSQLKLLVVEELQRIYSAT